MDIDPRLLCGCRKGGGRWRGREGDERDTVRSAEREERERRRAEARRYPIDDTELLAELREKAYAEGTPLPAPSTLSFLQGHLLLTSALLRCLIIDDISMHCSAALQTLAALRPHIAGLRAGTAE